MDRPTSTGPRLEGELMQSLSRSALFEGINDKHLQRLAGIGSEERHSRGEYVFREDDPGDKFYLILEGAVRIERQVPGMGQEALAVLKAGAAFGEMALIEDFPRSADAVVHQDCRLFVVRKDDLEDLLFLDRDLAYEVLWKMVRVLSARLRETTNKMAFLTFAGKFE